MVNKKMIVIVAIMLFAFIAIVFVTTPAQTGYFLAGQEKPVKIGAILALSGPSSVWGESVQNGMELALVDHPEIQVTYDDSKGTAADGISAYQKLKQEDQDMFISALSIVNVPLAKLANEDKEVLLITQSAANNITNEYTYRYYTDANHFAAPTFESSDSPIKTVKKLAVIHRSDDYAKSVAQKVQELAKNEGKEIVFFEQYVANETDFSTILTKAKATKPDALLYIPTPPSESLAILKKVQELDFNAIIIEVSNVQSDPVTQSKAPKITFYTNEFAFSKSGNSEEFKAKYREKYNSEPNFVAAFGYDMINLVASCKTQEIKTCLDNTTKVSGVTGNASDIQNHDIVIPMYLKKVN